MTDARTVRVCAAARQKRRATTAEAIAPAANRTASTQASFSRDFRRATTGAGRPAAEPPSATHLNSSITSCAVCQRSSGSLARQVLTTLSNAGGVIGATVDTGGGSVPMIDEINDAWLLPENAFFPVAIS